MARRTFGFWRTIMQQHSPSTTGQPAGIWQDLAEARPTRGARHIYKRLAQATPTGTAGVWAALAVDVDPTQYKPHAIADVAEEQVTEGEQELTVIRSPRGNYLRLQPEERGAWQRMDGTRTVSQLGTWTLMTYGRIVLFDVLVAALRKEGFLQDPSVDVYANLSRHVEEQSSQGWGQRMLRFLAGRRFPFGPVDSFYGALYRAGGWLLFTPVFLVLWALVVLAGLGSVGYLLATQERVLAGGNLPLYMVTLWLMLLLSFFFHESAHALAVKHFRRIVGAGGVMLYFGLPAFYVDTTDIWRSPRRARVLVSAVGPMSDLFVGSIAAMVALLLPVGTFSTVGIQLAFTCLLSGLLNVNPLLELDGYYILVDLLRLPNLRQRALAFVRGPLWVKLRTGGTSLLSREEKILSLYGVLSLVYTAVAVWLALLFWERWLFQAIQNLWSSGVLLNQVIAVLLVVVVVIPVVLAIALVAIGVVRSSVAWLIQRGYGRRPNLVAGASAAVVVVLALFFGRDAGPWYAQVLPLAFWLVAGAALLMVRPDYEGAAIGPALDALVPATLLAGMASLLRMVVPDAWIWQAVDGLALLFLLLAALIAQLEVRIRLTPPRVQMATGLMLIASFVVGGFVLVERLELVAAGGQPLDAAAPLALLVALPAYFGALALTLLLPYIFSLADSRLIWSWALFWGAALAQAGAYIVDLRTPSAGLDLLAAGLWAAAWITHLATLRQLTPAELPWEHVAGLSERQRLERAFQLCYAGCYRLLRAVYGARRTRELDDRMDVIAATANWNVRLDRDLAEIGVRLANSSLDFQGARFAEVLRYTVSTIEDLAGASFARRTIQAAYDALPWPERETAGRLCFPDTPWARELSSGFGDAQAARGRLLREVDVLFTCDDAELAALGQVAQRRKARAGDMLVRASEPSPGLWIVEAGEILALDGTTVEDELHRAKAFGLAEALAGEPITRSYRASVDSVLLFIPTAELQELTRSVAPHAAEATAEQTVRMLERVPVFSLLPRDTLRSLAPVIEARQFARRDLVIRRGVASGVLYIIEQGRAAVLLPEPPVPGEKPKLRRIASLGPGEFFGELEMLDDRPSRHFVLAESELSVLTLPHEAAKAVLLGDKAAARSLEQISSARRMA